MLYATYQRVFSQQILICELLSIVIDEIERSSDLGLADALSFVRYPLPYHARLLVGEVCI